MRRRRNALIVDRNSTGMYRSLYPNWKVVTKAAACNFLLIEQFFRQAIDKCEIDLVVMTLFYRTFGRVREFRSELFTTYIFQSRDVYTFRIMVSVSTSPKWTKNGPIRSIYEFVNRIWESLRISSVSMSSTCIIGGSMTTYIPL